MNSTMKTFGYPDTLVKEYENWVILLRKKQATLGALVLICKDGATEFSRIGSEAFVELAEITKDIETSLGSSFGYQKINYLMLMMVDPHVHFHVIPRYAEPKTFDGKTFTDPGWPAVPNLGHATEIDASTEAALIKTLQDAWP